MQQLQSLYRGDQSPSLSQIFGMQYQPQQAISQAANTAVGSGMSAGAQVKTTAMNNATQMAIADANRLENRRQFNLTNILNNRNASETERHNLAAEGNADRVTDWNTGGQQAAGDEEAKGIISYQINTLTTALNSLDKNDPAYDRKAQYLRDRIKSIQDESNKAAQTRGGLTGFAKGLTNTYAKGGLLEGLGKELTRIAGQTPDTPATPAAPAAAPGVSGSGVTVDRDSAGLTIKGLNSPLSSYSIIPSGKPLPTLAGSILNSYGSGQNNLFGATTLGGQTMSGTITMGGAPAATTPPAGTPPAGAPAGATATGATTATDASSFFPGAGGPAAVVSPAGNSFFPSLVPTQKAPRATPYGF